MSFKIIGTGSSHPKQSVRNAQLSEHIETDDEWITSRTGISSRFICETETAADLAADAAMKAMKAAGVAPRELCYIICPTIGGDYVTPSLASCLAGRIGAACPAFDLNAACTGYLYALSLSAGLLDSGAAKKILIVCAERMSNRVDWGDRGTCILFGDGAGASVLTAGNSLRYIRLSTASDITPINLPSARGNCPFSPEREVPKYLQMDGPAVFRYAAKTIVAEALAALESLKISGNDVDYFLAHQANERIIENARRKLGQDKEKFPTNISRWGNTSSATIPILLDEMIEAGKIKKGMTLMLTAFGAGLTQGCCVIEW